MDIRDVRMMTIEQGCDYTGMGKTFFRKWASDIGARVEITKRMTRYDKAVIDTALDKMLQGGEGND